MWLGFGGGASTLEGSPIDSLVFFILIFAAFVALARRRLNWSAVISENWPIFLFYAFLLISVLWANSPFISFKRWFKEFGNIAVLLVILTDPRPQQAVRAVFVRCACLLLPLSFVLIRYYPLLNPDGLVQYPEHQNHSQGRHTKQMWLLPEEAEPGCKNNGSPEKQANHGGFAIGQVHQIESKQKEPKMNFRLHAHCFGRLLFFPKLEPVPKEHQPANQKQYAK